MDRKEEKELKEQGQEQKTKKRGRCNVRGCERKGKDEVIKIKSGEMLRTKAKK